MSSRGKKQNLILISLDTVRADVAYSGKFRTLEKLRRHGVSFLNTTATAPLTPVSHASIFTGLQPARHGIRHLFKEKMKPRTKTLAQILKQEGYLTGAIVSCPGLNAWYGLNKGFNFYDDEIPRLADGSDPLKTVDVKQRGTALKRAPLVVARALQWLDAIRQRRKPFFLFIHFFDAHWPYQAPEKFGGGNAYEEEIAYADHYLGQFLTQVDQWKLLASSAIVCLSDHGEDLAGLYQNDKGGRKLGHPEEAGHGCLLYEQTQQVPLIFNSQKLSRHQDITQPARLVDVLPTILELLDIDYAADGFDGISLVPAIRGKPLRLVGYSETFYPAEQTVATGGRYAQASNKKSLRLGNQYKIIFHLKNGSLELYDLTQDPHELKNLVD